MLVVIVGATGNSGTSLIGSLAQEDRVDSVVGVARRKPDIVLPKVTWVAADITVDDLDPIFAGADAVVHLAWLIQPSRDLGFLRAVNVEGTRRVLRAVADARVPNLVYASSVGAYSPGSKQQRVDETWPTEGVSTSFYSRHKAETERMLDSFEADIPQVRVVRLRPGLIFKRESASGQRRLFAGPLLPNYLVRKRLIPFVPDTPRLVFQCVHSYDIGEAYRLALVSDVRGAFNVAAEPPIGPAELGELMGARRVRLSEGAIRSATAASWRAHVQPTPEGWVDLAFESPLMDVSRATAELGWKPQRTSFEALDDLIDGLGSGAGFDTPPLDPGSKGLLRIKELAGGIGSRER
ncbi:MAG TPA: NAD-dependent epimerase/dehydratase family protein [Actinomycetota bacterium]|nr:NAD-dependent epimerase/dehydratase family protein [Actinomycetota bacterium]